MAPFLARRGFDVYAGNLRRRGESRPHVGRSPRYAQTEAITEDIPAFIDYVAGLHSEAPRHRIAHSWGGVLYPPSWRAFRSAAARCVRWSISGTSAVCG